MKMLMPSIKSDHSYKELTLPRNLCSDLTSGEARLSYKSLQMHHCGYNDGGTGLLQLGANFQHGGWEDVSRTKDVLDLHLISVGLDCVSQGCLGC